MSDSRPSVLLVDDEANILKTMKICFEESGFNISAFQNPQLALDSVHQQKYDLAFVDLKMSPINGMQLLRAIKDNSPQTTVVIITAHGSIGNAVEAVKAGAYDYIQKPFDYVELQLIANRVLDYHKLKNEIRLLKKADSDYSFITKNMQMKDMLNLAVRVATSDITVLIEGESGTGKELIADLVFEKSDRNDKSFIKINCAALPENLLESELFGHVKGSFSGAVKDRKGRFEEADGGTVFLDEIGELSPQLQAKLLRVLQNREVTRVGENEAIQVDVRIIAATNKNLEAAISEGGFREDLYYRLNAVRLRLTPLRERPEDLLPLIKHLAEKHDNTVCDISPQVLQLLRQYRWNGNVRELENVIRRATLLAGRGTIEERHLPDEIAQQLNNNNDILSLEEIERMQIAKVLNMAKDLQEAARLLGIDPATLWRKRKRYQL